MEVVLLDKIKDQEITDYFNVVRKDKENYKENIKIKIKVQEVLEAHSSN